MLSWAPVQVPLRRRLGQFAEIPDIPEIPEIPDIPEIPPIGEQQVVVPPSPPAPRFMPQDEKTIWDNPNVRAGFTVLALASAAASAYHGYKRNDSVGWGIWWALMGGMFPIITIPIAFAQGFAKPAKKK